MKFYIYLDRLMSIWFRNLFVNHLSFDDQGLGVKRGFTARPNWIKKEVLKQYETNNLNNVLNRRAVSFGRKKTLFLYGSLNFILFFFVSR